MKLIFTILAGLLVLSATIAFGQIGGLDTTFGQDGKVTTLVTYTSGANALALQTDGKIVAAGYAYNGTKYEFAVVRYNTDGSIDTTFGMEGMDTTRLRTGNSIATGVAIEPNGKIILAGRSSNVNLANPADTTVQFALARYTTNGLLDSTFGTNGIDTFYVGSKDDEANGIAIQPDGKILVGGLSNYAKGGLYSDFALIRIDTNGILDTSFNTKDSGKILTAIGNYNDRAYALALQQDGKILLAGTSANGSNYVFATVRYLTNGTLDSSFNTVGYSEVNFSGGNSTCYSIAVQPNGKIVLGGFFSLNGGSYANLARITASGDIDTTLAHTGKITVTTYLGAAFITAVAIDSIERVITAGYTYNRSAQVYEFTLVRYDSLGVIDTTFGDSTGMVETNFGTANAEASAMVIQHNGKILVAGYAQNAPKEQFALARYNIDTITIAPTAIGLIAENNSLLIYPNPVHSDAVLKYTLTNNETLTIKVYDLMGHVVQSVITNENQQAGTYTELLNFETLPAGCYFASLTNNNSQSISVKIIKQ